MENYLCNKDQIYYKMAYQKKKKNYKMTNMHALMWHLVRGNVLEFPRMFKDSYVWLQITLGNQMPEESGFPL